MEIAVGAFERKIVCRIYGPVHENAHGESTILMKSVVCIRVHMW